MSVQEQLRERIESGLDAAHVEVENESGQHNVAPGSETHFRVVVVSHDFEGRTRLARHRAVYALVAEEMREGVHALALHAYTPAEWARRGAAAPASPECRGGMAREARGR